VGAKVIVMDRHEVVTIEVSDVLEEYQYARSEYRNSIGDQQRDFWDGYLAAIEKLCSDVVLNEEHQ
jgi:hypothetical protein